MSPLRIIGPASIEVWISSPVRSRKPVLMNTTRSLAARMHSLRLTVVRRSSSMMPILMVLCGIFSVFSTRAKISDRELHLVRPVHLGLHYIDRAGARILVPAVRADVMQRDQRGDHRVHDALRHLVPLAVDDRRVGHQVADVSHQHQRAAFQFEGRAVRRLVFEVGIELARKRPAALLDLFSEVALHQAEPVAVGCNLVLGIDGGDGILEILDRRDGRFQPHVGNMRRVVLADGRAGVDQHLDMDAVVFLAGTGWAQTPRRDSRRISRAASGPSSCRRRARPRAWRPRPRSRARASSWRRRAARPRRGGCAPRRSPLRRGWDCSPCPSPRRPSREWRRCHRAHRRASPSGRWRR